MAFRGTTKIAQTLLRYCTVSSPTLRFHTGNYRKNKKAQVPAMLLHVVMVFAGHRNSGKRSSTNILELWSLLLPELNVKVCHGASRHTTFYRRITNGSRCGAGLSSRHWCYFPHVRSNGGPSSLRWARKSAGFCNCQERCTTACVL